MCDERRDEYETDEDIAKGDLDDLDGDTPAETVKGGVKHPAAEMAPWTTTHETNAPSP